MYRIRLATGEEAVYRTVQELAQAVASGMVSPTAEVYHKAANRWLPINTHPDYRAAMATGTQTAINPAIQIPMAPGKGSPAVTSGKSPAIETPPGPSSKSPAIAVPPSGKTPAVTVPKPPSGKRPAPPELRPAPGLPLIEADFVPSPAPGSTVRSPALPAEPVKPNAEPEKSSTRQSAAIPVRPSSSSTIKTTAIPPVEPEFPAEIGMFDLTAMEPPAASTPGIALPPMPTPARILGIDRGRLVLIASIAALLLAVGVTGLILFKTRPKQYVQADTTQAAGTLPPPAGDSVERLVDSVPVARPQPTPAVPVRAARPAPAENFPAPSKPLPAPVTTPRRDTTPKAVVPPPVRPKPAPSSRTPSYFQAYADARSEMDESLSYVSFRRVFAPGRFVSMDSLRATKRMVVAAGNILRVYRGREVMLEQQYRPDDPGGRNSLREPFETSEASRALLSDVDSLFGLLVGQDGEITVSEREIRFRSSKSARAYNDMRREIMQTISTWRDSAEASNRVTMPRLVQALGTAAPPIAR